MMWILVWQRGNPSMAQKLKRNGENIRKKKKKSQNHSRLKDISDETVNGTKRRKRDFFFSFEK